MLISGFKPDVNVDMVLRRQGADPAVIRKRRPGLIKIANQAIKEGQSLIKPMVIERSLKVLSLHGDYLELEKGFKLSGSLISHCLAPAEQVVLMVCTIGSQVEDRASSMFNEDPMLSLALDSFGTVAVEVLSIKACNYIEINTAAEGMQTSIPLSPGMIGWDIMEGQTQLFKALRPEPEIVRLLPAGKMIYPRKSLTMVIGIGKNLEKSGRKCDYCTMQSNCKYKLNLVKS